MTFVEALREAHAVHTAVQMGDNTCAAICQRTRLPFPVVREWTRLLNIRLVEPFTSRVDGHPGLVLDNITEN